MIWKCIFHILWTALAREVMQSPPSVCCSTICFYSIFRTDWLLTLNFCMWVGHDHSSLGIEGQTNAVGATSMEGSLFSSYVCIQPILYLFAAINVYVDRVLALIVDDVCTCVCVCSRGCVLLLTTVTSFAAIPRHSCYLILLTARMTMMKTVIMSPSHTSLVVTRLF